MSRSFSRRPSSPRNRVHGIPPHEPKQRADNVTPFPVKPDRWGSLIPVDDRSERGKHDVVLIDPPWPMASWSTKGREKMPGYETQSLEELMQLGRTVRSLLAKDAVALVWCTAPQLSNAMVVVAQWGLSYRTYRVWKKRKLGLGYWTRSDCEILLICTRGKPKTPKRGKQGRAIFEGQPKDKRHSSKPVCMHEWVEEHYPEARKLELFARNERDGWTTYGGDLGTWITPEGIRDTRAKFANARRPLEVADAEIVPFPKAKARKSKGRK